MSNFQKTKIFLVFFLHQNISQCHWSCINMSNSTRKYFFLSLNYSGYKVINNNNYAFSFQQNHYIKTENSKTQNILH